MKIKTKEARNGAFYKLADVIKPRSGSNSTQIHKATQEF